MLTNPKQTHLPIGTKHEVMVSRAQPTLQICRPTPDLRDLCHDGILVAELNGQTFCTTISDFRKLVASKQDVTDTEIIVL